MKVAVLLDAEQYSPHLSTLGRSLLLTSHRGEMIVVLNLGYLDSYWN